MSIGRIRPEQSGQLRGGASDRRHDLSGGYFLAGEVGEYD